MKVLIADKFEQSGIDGLRVAGCDVVYEPDLKEDSLIRALRDTGAEVLVVRGTPVTAPMLEQGIDVDLPETTTQPLQMREEPLILSVKKDGTYHLARQAVPLEELEPKLKAIFEGTDEKEIYLRADKDAPYGTVVKAMAAARLAGAKTVGIVPEPE